MDKFLTIKEKQKPRGDETLASRSAPIDSKSNVLYSGEVERLKVWLSNSDNDAGFLSGFCGSGVTTLIRTMLRELDFEAYHINHSDKDFTNQLVLSNTTNVSVLGKKRVVVIDGLDSTSADKRCLNIIIDHVLKGSKNKFLCAGHFERRNKSNEFAQKWVNFQLPAPSNERVVEELIRINSGEKNKLTKREIQDLVKKHSLGDIRSCINSLELEQKLKDRTKEDHSKDLFIDGIDAIEFMLDKTSDASFKDIYKIYEQEPMTISMGVHENYMKNFHKDEIDDVLKIATDISSADILHENMSKYQEWDQLYGHCALAVCNTKMLIGKSKAKTGGAVDKFGTIWSKINNQKSNAKKLSAIQIKRMENNMTVIPSADLSYVRFIVKNKIDGDEAEFVDTCYPWGQEDILSLFRTGFEPYKHAKVKKIFERVTKN